MARIRSVKPDFWDDDKLSTISRAARLDFIGLWNHADDYGVVKASPLWLRNHLYPNEDEKRISVKMVELELAELESIRSIVPFEANGERFYFIRNFNEHQHINRRSEKRNPPPPDEILNDSSGRSEGSLSPHQKSTHPLPQNQSPSPEPKKAEIPDIIAQWNRFAQGHEIPAIDGIVVGSARERALLARLGDKGFDFEAVLRAIHEQPFLYGDNDRGWLVGFDWILKPANLTKVMERAYVKDVRGRARDRAPEDPQVGGRR